MAIRVVVSLATQETLGNKPAQYLNPELAVDGRRLILLTQEMAGVPIRQLGAAVTSLAGHRAEIVRALDVVLSGL